MRGNYLNIIRSLTFLKEVTHKRISLFLDNGKASGSFDIPDLKIEHDDVPLNHLLVKQNLNIEEYIILLLALAPHLEPNLIDTVVQECVPQGGDFPELGGVKGTNHRGMLPTGETAQFILAGNDIEQRLRIADYFSPHHFFYKQGILALEAVKEGEPRMSGRIILSQEYVDLLTVGKISSPVFSPDFPAKLIETQMTWDDLVLRPTTQMQIDDIKMWLEHHQTLQKDPIVSRKLKPGYRVLFYGPPGTGKTLTASLLGKQFEKDVYRVDLSQVVSKFIGETEKNLEKVFSKAEHKNWILFFDEADALFGKRSNISSAHDKYANQEVSYLLQRVEDFPGLIILASNAKNNIDSAFVRRFNAIIHFPMPDAAERLKLWQGNVPASVPVEDGVLLKYYADKVELSGSAITNIMQYAALAALGKEQGVIREVDIKNGIRRELLKEDKIFEG
ncbi:MAG TPA: ATP-binding protein [Cyclobacteriaceae bacterium]|nr:ATP-binding protein [Cyclobacteriaceae bacterium]